MLEKHFQIVLVILIFISNAYSKGSPWDWQVTRYPSLSNPSGSDNGSLKTQAITKNITATVGQTALLPCRTRYLNKHNMVSWVRSRDTTVLSVGRHAFNSDKRISVATTNPRLDQHESDWTLQIGVVTPKDEGWYQCQINTEPKISNMSYLNIRSPDTDNNRGLQDAPQSQQVIPQIQEFLSNALPPSRIPGNGRHSSHRWKNANDAFRSKTTDRTDKQPIALPQLEPPLGSGGGVNGENLASRVQALETRLAKLEDRINSMVSSSENTQISYSLACFITLAYTHL